MSNAAHIRLRLHQLLTQAQVLQVDVTDWSRRREMRGIVRQIGECIDSLAVDTDDESCRAAVDVIESVADRLLTLRADFPPRVGTSR